MQKPVTLDMGLEDSVGRQRAWDRAPDLFGVELADITSKHSVPRNRGLAVDGDGLFSQGRLADSRSNYLRTGYLGSSDRLGHFPEEKQNCLCLLTSRLVRKVYRLDDTIENIVMR